MWASLLSFLGALASAAPKVLEMLRDWRVRDAAAKDQAAKDERNRKAVDEALRSPGGR